jgi:hypothetical protein
MRFKRGFLSSVGRCTLLRPRCLHAYVRIQVVWGLDSHATETTRGQCHLNKKNVTEALLFEGKALLSRSLAMERGIGALDDAGVKAQTAWREQC